MCGGGGGGGGGGGRCCSTEYPRADEFLDEKDWFASKYKSMFSVQEQEPSDK